MVEFRNVANFDAVWLPQWRRAETRAYGAKKSKKKVCSDYLFENSCKFNSENVVYGVTGAALVTTVVSQMCII